MMKKAQPIHLITVIAKEQTISTSAMLTSREIPGEAAYFRYYLAAYYNTYSHLVDFLASRT
jgi:hypothetical protein